MTISAELFIRNASQVPMWNALVSQQDVDDIFNATGGTIFCNGMLREVHTKNITERTIKVFTKEIK